jgi:carboxyl-terminal processing protease
MNRSLIKNIGFTVVVIVITVILTGFRYDFFEIAKQIEIYNTLFKEINMGYVDKTDPAKLMEDGVKHMLSELDPYTIYSSEQDVEDAKIYRSGVYVGIGAKMKIIDKKLFVEEPFKGFSADDAGLKAGDEIIEINGIALSESFQQAEILLNGKKNSSVRITFKRGEKENEVELIRNEQKPKAVPLYQMLEDEIGYIALDRFSRGAAQEVEYALKFLLIDEVKGLILDLRNNPGGLLQEAVEIVNLFVPKNQLIVSTQSNIEQYNTQFITQKQPISEDIPLVVLINERSASASEIVAGALQDLDRAVVVGNRSFGKGLVQQPKPLPYGAQIKVTISRYFIPSGRCIQALNYGERSESGKAQRRQKEDYKAFKTKNGRTVFDGGGINPDISTNTIDKFDLISNLKKENLFFNFVTDYCATNSIGDLESFELDPSVFKAFRTFCFAEGFSLNTNTEKHLKKALDYSEEEDLNNLSGSLESVRKSLETEKKLVFNQSEERIMWQLSEEIIKRNFYKEGVYQYSLLKNNAIQKAKSVLEDSQGYYSLLK